MSASVWDGTGEDPIPVANANNTFLTEGFISTAGQTVFTLTQFQYTPNSGSLDVYVSGVKQATNGVYVETDSTTVTFLSPIYKAGVYVEFKGMIGNEAAQSALVSANVAAAAAVSALVSEGNADTSEANALNYSNNSYTYSQQAAASATLAQQIATGLISTSVSTVSYGTGVKNFIVSPNKLFQPGQFITASAAVNPNTNWIYGVVQSYNTVTGELAITAAAFSGAGSNNNWYISISSIQGPQGIQGIQGIQGATTLKTSSRNSNTIITNADSGKYIELTGTFTQTFDTPANLTDTFYLYLENVSTGDITIPSSDGVTNWKMYPEEVRLFVCDGVTIKSKPLKTFNKTYTSLSTFVKPPGYSEFCGYVHGAGASGSRDVSTSSPLGGAGGSRFPFILPASLFGVSEVITVGSGGAPVTSGGGVASHGGVTSIGTIISIGNPTAPYYQAVSINGTTAISTSTNAVGFETIAYNTSSTGNTTIYGGLTSFLNQNGASVNTSIYGSGNGGSITNGVSTPAGTSKYAGNGGAAGSIGGTNGTNGVIPGGGGGAATNAATTSGAGARGEINIRGRI